IVVGEATEKAKKSDLFNLESIVTLINNSYKNNQIDQVLHYGEKFHSYIYDLSGNNTIKNFLSQLNDHIRRYRQLIILPSQGYKVNYQDDHELILEYMKKGDKLGAQKIMKEHIEKSLKIAISKIEQLE